MKIIIESSILDKIEKYVRDVTRFLYSWISTDGEVLGYILGVIHFVVGVTISIMVIVSHTIYPAFWLKCIVFLILFAIWLQHIVFKVCIVIIAEQKLTKGDPPYFKIFKDMTGIDGSNLVTHLVVFETGALIAFSLELVSEIVGWYYKV